MPALPLIKKGNKLLRVSNDQLVGARPSIVKPRSPFEPERTISGRNADSNPKAPPPEVVEANMEEVRLDEQPPPPRSGPRDRFASLQTPAPVFMRMQNQGRSFRSRYQHSTNLTKFLTVAVVLIIVALIIGLAAGLSRRNSESKKTTADWQPDVGTKWQLQVRNPLREETLLHARDMERNPTNASVFDIDLFYTNEAQIKKLHAQNIKVMCHFSAGTFEIWRPDIRDFHEDIKGEPKVGRAGTKWLDISSDHTLAIMKKRIELAVKKGCDAVDPGDTDAYYWPMEGTGFEPSQNDSVEYVRELAAHAHKKGLAIGLNNSPELASRVIDAVDFSICDSCIKRGNCYLYQQFIKAGKPVFHVEYARETASKLKCTTAEMLDWACKAPSTEQFSSIVKRGLEDEWLLDCAVGDPSWEG